MVGFCEVLVEGVPPSKDHDQEVAAGAVSSEKLMLFPADIMVVLAEKAAVVEV